MIMAPSLVSAVASAVLFSAAASAASYQLFDSYTADNFLEKFQPFVSDHTTGNYNDVDPTSGYVSYKSVAEAQELGILKTVGDEWYMGVDTKSSLNPSGIGRASVRLESTQKYNKGLFIADFSHLPKPTCGTWPAFWTVGLPWPQGGEIDIYEAWNLDASSRFVMHTDASVGACGIDGKGMTAEKSKPNCAGDAPGQGKGEGCAAFDSSAPYASSKGGVYAMEWTAEAIKIWAFTHDNVPKDLATNPNPENWGNPRYRSAKCDVDKVFDDAQLIMNIGFCGVAGHKGQWDECAAKTGEADCPSYVAKNPAAFKSSYFQVRSIKVYKLGESEGGSPPGYGEGGDDNSEGETETPETSPSVPVRPSNPAPSSVGYGLPEESEQPEETSSSVPVRPSNPPVSSVGYDLPEESEQPEETLEPAPEPTDECSYSEPSDVPEETTSAALPVPPVETPPPTSSERLTTLTITETSIATITSCPPEAAAECPGLIGSTTEIVVVTTTVCPVTDVATTLTVTRTSVKTATSCAPDVPNCPNEPTTVIETTVIETTTPVAVTEPKPTTAETQSDALPVPSATKSTEVPEETIPPPTEETVYPQPEDTTVYPPPEETVPPPGETVPPPSGETLYPPPEESVVSEPQETVSDALPTQSPFESETPSSTSERLTTLTISETTTSTITSCPPEVETECPAVGTTVIVEITTTVCPVVDVPTTLTISRTKVHTITSCPPEVPDCPGVPTTIVETEVIETTTPVPLTESTTTSALPEQPTPPTNTAYVPPPTPEVPYPQPTPERPTPEQPVPEQPTPEQPAPEEPVPEEPVPEQSTPEQPVPEQPTPEQPAPEPPVSQTVPVPPEIPTTLVTESFVATFTPPLPINSDFPTESIIPDIPLPAHGGPRLGAGALTLAAGVAAGVAAILL